MEKIIIKPEVVDFIEDLVGILYKKEYFGFEEDAIYYTDKIYDFIATELTKSKHKLSPKRLAKFGKFYSVYKVNKRTTWYVFFSKKDNRLYIEYLTNNHVANAAFINEL